MSACILASSWLAQILKLCLSRNGARDTYEMQNPCPKVATAATENWRYISSDFASCSSVFSFSLPPAHVIQRDIRCSGAAAQLSVSASAHTNSLSAHHQLATAGINLNSPLIVSNKYIVFSLDLSLKKSPPATSNTSWVTPLRVQVTLVASLWNPWPWRP
jgi:hypothetical protein